MNANKCKSCGNHKSKNNNDYCTIADDFIQNLWNCPEIEVEFDNNSYADRLAAGFNMTRDDYND